TSRDPAHCSVQAAGAQRRDRPTGSFPYRSSRDTEDREPPLEEFLSGGWSRERSRRGGTPRIACRTRTLACASFARGRRSPPCPTTAFRRDDPSRTPII